MPRSWPAGCRGCSSRTIPLHDEPPITRARRHRAGDRGIASTAMTLSSLSALSPVGVEPRVTGSAIAYRLFDVGYEIHLERAVELLASSAPARVRPVRGEAQTIQIKNPPIAVVLGTERLPLPDGPCEVTVDARIF